MFYLDNAATTPVLPEVLEKSLPYLTDHFGNPSSLHVLGMEVARSIKTARQEVAKWFRVPAEYVTFTSGGSESNHLALWGAAHAIGLKGKRIVVSEIEHPSILRTVEKLGKQGFEVVYVRTLAEGIIDLDHLDTLMNEETRIVSCMAVNNEVGTRQPLDTIGPLLKLRNPKSVFHVDATQAIGKIPLPIKTAKIDLISLSGHKIGAPKGIGALIASRPLNLESVILGGGQENGLRSGTENVFGIIALAEAFKLAEKNRESTWENLAEFRQNWMVFLKQNCSKIQIYQSPHTLPHYLNLALVPVPAEVFLHHLEAEEIYVSNGSACSSRKAKHSHVLQAIGMHPELVQSMIRLSFGQQNVDDNQEELFRRFTRVYQELKSLM